MSSSTKLIAGTAILAVVAAGGAAFAAMRLSDSTGSTAEPALTAPYSRGIADSGLGGGRLGGRGFGGGLGPGRRSGFRGFGGPASFGGVSTAVSGYLGLNAGTLRADLEKGETLAQIAKTQGKSVDGLVTTMLTEQKKHIDAAVSRGFLTEAQAQELESNLEEHISDMVNGVHPHRAGAPVPPGPTRLPDQA